jgi:hypothetical protein
MQLDAESDSGLSSLNASDSPPTVRLKTQAVASALASSAAASAATPTATFCGRMTPHREFDGPGDPDAALTSSMRQLTLFGKPVKRTYRQLEREVFWDCPAGKGETREIILPAGTVSEPSLAEERALKLLPDDEATPFQFS